MRLPSGLELDHAWHEAIRSRVSTRTFDGHGPSPDKTAALDLVAAATAMATGVRTIWLDNPADDLFTGYAGSYGRITKAPRAVAFVAAQGEEVAVGYAGEAFVLEATRLGLGTCWVAGSYDRKRAAELTGLADGERILSLTPVGTPARRRPADERLMRALVRASARKPLDVIAPGHETWPHWAQEAAEAARWAPTGGNGQPQRLRFEGDSLVVGRAAMAYWTAPIDLGIVMLHAELGAATCGVCGDWRPATGTDAAAFVPRP